MTIENIDECVEKMSKGSVIKQVALGAVIGLSTGFLINHVGKPISIAAGGSLLFAMIANNQGWIKINWSKVENVLDKAKQKIEKSKNDTTYAKIKDFTKKNIYVVGGFAGGFLIGVSC